MLRLGQVALVVALVAIPSLTVAAQEAPPVGPNAIAAPAGTPAEIDAAVAAACDRNLSRSTSGGGKIKRYTLTYLYALTEYDRVTCAANGKGAWTLNSQQKCGTKNCGTVTFGTLTSLPLGNGDCPGHLYDFAAICYTWNIHSDEKIRDVIIGTWKSPHFTQPHTFPVNVPIVYPSSETSSGAGWDGFGAGLWKQTLHSASDPTFDWALNTVQETDPGTGKSTNDTCWCKGSTIQPFWRITGGTWFPDEKGVWEFDHVGWYSPSVRYYRAKQRAPCGTTFPQQMQFQATNVSKTWVNYGKVNTLGGSFTYSTVTSLRAGLQQTHTFEATPPKARLACTLIHWPIAVAAFGSSIVVDDPRPVAAAIDEIERRSGRPITYEDPPILNSNHMMPMVRGGKDSALLMPRGGSLRFSLPANDSPEQVLAALERMVETYNVSHGAATFSVLRDGLTHVVPRQTVDASGRPVAVTPVLDSRITVAAKRRNAMELLEEITRAVSLASGQTVEIGTVPMRALLRRQVEIGANSEPARNVLEKLIVASGMPLSWRLLYDPGLKAYYLNIPLVQ